LGSGYKNNAQSIKTESGAEGNGEFTTASGELLLYSGCAMGEKHEYGVGLILS